VGSPPVWESMILMRCMETIQKNGLQIVQAMKPRGARGLETTVYLQYF